MDKEGFRQFLRGRSLPERAIEDGIAVAERFEAFLAGPDRPGPGGPATAEDAQLFARQLIGEGHNSYDDLVALARYGRFIGSDTVYVAVVTLLDGAEALQNLHRRLGRALGRKERDWVFHGIALPPLGTPTTELPAYTQAVMARLEKLVDPAVYRPILAAGLRDLRSQWFLPQRRKYRKSPDIDAYLASSHREYIAELEQLRTEGRLYFTQEVTEEMLDLVRGNPEIGTGVRKGALLYHTKIPHMTKEYLAEADESKKRYYYCHCPWVKESLRPGGAHVSPEFCLCSAGFVKKPWEVILGRPLEVDVLETVLTGGLVCRFAIHLPAEALPEAQGTGQRQSTGR
ncbi:MAG TPA: hypothetical protein PKO09_03300 [Anaerolineae bacterium]|nr:hypothetical protein [Anaerolineae bacterium]